MKKQIVGILGSTGSIGQSALRVLSAPSGGNFTIGLLAAGSSWKEFVGQVNRQSPLWIYLDDPSARRRAMKKLTPMKTADHGVSKGSRWLINRAQLLRSLAQDSYDRLVVALSDFEFAAQALESALGRRDRKIVVLAASKEPMVVMGSYFRFLAERNGHQLIPVDSEPSAIFQCLGGNFKGAQDIHRIILTASGGPFYRNSVKHELVTPQMALRHPTWTMGRKITIDSATMVNKALEAMEIEELFGLSLDQIKIRIHPQSVIHSMVEFKNSSVIAQAGVADMALPIHYGLWWPRAASHASPARRIDWDSLRRLDFDEPDLRQFPCLAVALEAARFKGHERFVARSAFLGADEALVHRFINGELSYAQFPLVMRKAVNRALAVFSSKSVREKTLKAALEVFYWAQDFVNHWNGRLFVDRRQEVSA
ncbi:MAG: 1-deoxy-D-xylulose-5-phosphate reductoisomerase [Elusimicrobia bacterium]|nr:1-deoxy-D-xylulose-5-phosphate reductoisomerase [Elusimicrobiota bacterium]